MISFTLGFITGLKLILAAISGPVMFVLALLSIAP